MTIIIIMTTIIMTIITITIIIIITIMCRFKPFTYHVTTGGSDYTSRHGFTER
jgi:hypothetical protein